MTEQLIKKNLPAFVQAKKQYLIALALNETNLSIDNEAKTETLRETAFFAFDKDAKEGELELERITDPERDYKLSESEFKKYLKLVHHKRLLKGLILPYHKYDWAKDEPSNLCADCETAPLLRLAEKAFIQASLNIVPESLRKHLKHITGMQNFRLQQKFIDINIRLEVGENFTADQIIKEVTA